MEVDEEYEAPQTYNNSRSSNNNNTSLFNSTGNAGSAIDSSGVLSTTTEKNIIHSPDGTTLTHTSTTTVRKSAADHPGQQPATEASTTTTTKTTTAMVPVSQSIYPMLENLRTNPSMSFSPVGMAMSMLDSDMSLLSSELSMVQGLIPDSQGICHYHRPVGILQKSYPRPIHDFNSINEIARRLRTRCLTSSATPGTGEGIKKGSVDVQKRAVQRALERISLNAPRYSQRLDTLKSDHARRYQWHEQKVAEIRKRETERMARYRAGRAAHSVSSGFSIEEIDADVADATLTPAAKKKKNKGKDKTMDSLTDDGDKNRDKNKGINDDDDDDDDDGSWLSDSEYDLEEASDMLALEALEMTERMRRRAAKRRTTAGGISKESAARGRRKGVQTHGYTAAAALIEAMGTADRRPSRGGSAVAGPRGTATRGAKASRGRLRGSAVNEHMRRINDQSAVKQLVSQMGNGDPDAILQIIRSGVSVDLCDSLGRLPLHVASSAGNIEAIRLLVHMGADVNTTDKIGNTPLTLAATGARSDVILALLEGGADPRVGQGLVSAMTMVRSRLRLLRMEIQQARVVERAATGSLSDLVPRVRERRRRAAAVAKECVDIIHLLRHYTHKRIEEEEEELDAQRGNILYEAFEISQTETTKSSPKVPSTQAVSELDSLSAQLMSLGFGSEPLAHGTAGAGDKGKMPETHYGVVGGSSQGAPDNPQQAEQAAADMLARTNEEDDQMEKLLQQFSNLLGDN